MKPSADGGPAWRAGKNTGIPKTLKCFHADARKAGHPATVCSLQVWGPRHEVAGRVGVAQ